MLLRVSFYEKCLTFLKESFGIMGDSATAMRDPVFYKWHAFINDIFLEHKNTLPAYETPQVINCLFIYS